jgi:hypothetical protein
VFPEDTVQLSVTYKVYSTPVYAELDADYLFGYDNYRLTSSSFSPSGPSDPIRSHVLTGHLESVEISGSLGSPIISGILEKDDLELSGTINKEDKLTADPLVPVINLKGYLEVTE